MTRASDPDAVPVALVYWGRLGSGAVITAQLAEAMAKDTRFELFVSRSLQSEAPAFPGLPASHDLSIPTFSGPLSLIVRTLLLPLTLSRLVRRLSQAGVRAVVTVMPHVWGWALQRALSRAGIRTLLIVHDAEPHPGERRPVFDALVRAEIHASDRIVTLSNHIAERLLTLGAAAEGRLTRLTHPVLTYPGGAAAGPRPARPFRLLFFGRILPYKGVGLLLEAFAILRVAGVDCTLRIVGRGDVQAPLALLRQRGLAIELGWVAPDEVGGILAQADAMALPYLEASQSGVAAAAYGAGLPVIATPVGGLAEQVIDGETGLVAAEVTAQSFAAAVRRLIETQCLYDSCRAGVARYAAAHGTDRFAAALGDAVLATIAAPPR